MALNVYLSNDKGNKSLSRLLGFLLTGTGFVFAIILFIVGLFKDIPTFNNEIDLIGYLFMIPGIGLLLGKTTIERIWGKRNGRNGQ